ncbi:MAG: VTT domain-containing protein [Usitatibacter sp.]
MTDPLALITRHGVLLVFTNVLLEQVGLPIPAVPTLILAGALAADGQMSVVALLAVAVIACLIGDLAWYFAGRLYGVRILRLLCKVSLSQDSCVREAEGRFLKWGSLTILLGKFLPGISTVAPPLAGAMKMGLPRFLLLDGLGSLVWSGAAVGAGVAFHRQITQVLDALENLGAMVLWVVAAALVGFIAYKWWRRHAFLKALSLARISVGDLRKLIDDGNHPVVVDVRSAAVRKLDGRFIPGALAIELDTLDARSAELPVESEIIFYCSCPNEATAAVAAKRLMVLGFPKVRPLHGGLDAWEAAGYEIERRIAA